MLFSSGKTDSLSPPIWFFFGRGESRETMYSCQRYWSRSPPCKREKTRGKRRTALCSARHPATATWRRSSPLKQPTRLYVCTGRSHPSGTNRSEMTSRWQLHTIRIASGLPIPAPRGSPAGPNQWFCGAPVVRARIPAYVVPLTVLARMRCVNAASADTTAAVRWWSMRSVAASTSSTEASSYSVTTWKGPKISEVQRRKVASSASMACSGTKTAVGSTAP
mmetsp:Transcript_12241/g.24425  ORF Transcript_12241/g.24425 Transcript_12241/m.24425 type:complete len:221 (-) Transcript_12241:24-686(-)